MTSRVPILALLPPIIFAALALAFYLGMQGGDPSELNSPFVGKPAPNVTQDALPGYANIPTQEALTNNEITLVNFWASWCPPCRAEHPNLQAFADQGLRIVGVNFNDQADDAQAYLESAGNPFVAVPFDPTGRNSFDWGVAAPPETFILAPDGTVLFKFTGPLVGSDLDQRFMPELEKAIAKFGTPE